MPAGFRDHVVKSFARLVKEHGFVPAKACAMKGFVPFLRNADENTCYSVLAREGADASDDWQVDFWVSPPDRPDDGLERLGLGYKILIGNTGTHEDYFFRQCEDRIITLLAHVKPLCQAVALELADPPFMTKRLGIYRLERSAFDMFARCAAEPRNKGLREIVEFGSAVAQGKGKLDELERRCVPAGEWLLQQDGLESDTKEFFKDRADFLGYALSRHIYVESLRNLSDKRLRVE